jgi:hypothetical protein
MVFQRLKGMSAQLQLLKPKKREITKHKFILNQRCFQLIPTSYNISRKNIFQLVYPYGIKKNVWVLLCDGTLKNFPLGIIIQNFNIHIFKTP